MTNIESPNMGTLTFKHNYNHLPNKMSVDKMSVDEMYVYEMSLDKEGL
jgi:hypothetical protein